MGNCTCLPRTRGVSLDVRKVKRGSASTTRSNSERGLTFEERYQAVDSTTTLGEGADALIYFGVDVQQRINVALKVVDFSRLTCNEKRLHLQHRFQVETDILSSIAHKNIITLYDFNFHPDKGVMVLEYAEGGDLFECCKQSHHHGMPESEAKGVMVGLIEAVRYIHSNNIVHRDLKPENVLLRSKHTTHGVLLADFGFAAYCEEGETLTELVGTLNYVAPEVLRSKPYGRPIDVWALGVIMFIILSGDFPFNDDDRNILYRQIIRGKFTFEEPRWKYISKEAKHLLLSLMVVDVSRRIMIDEVLLHPWITSYQDPWEDFNANDILDDTHYEMVDPSSSALGL
jgi:serine/threonine protein kinase